jgi:hypothetical protein
MNIFKRLYRWAVSVYNDILEGNLTEQEADDIFCVFISILCLAMVIFIVNFETLGAVFEL